MKTNYRNFLALLLVIFLFVCSLPAQDLSREQCIADARQLVCIIEACHPDPYTNTNGKIGFHLAFHNLLKEIPEDGMPTEDFWWLLSGLLANIKDGHTYLYPLKQPDQQNPGGIPLRFSVMADSVLVVKRVSRSDLKFCIGSRVLRINNLEIDRLLERVASFYPMENIFDRFRNLKVYLWYGEYLKRLLPDWTPGSPVALELMNGAGKRYTISLATDTTAVYKTESAGTSSLQLPGTERCDFVFDWLGQDRNIAYLRIDKQEEFREYAEQLIAELRRIEDPDVLKGYRQQYLMYAHQWYTRYHGTAGPDSLELLVRRLPSFTEFMKKVAGRLKESSPDHLIIDVRNNMGGVSLLSDILIYFLFGKERLAELHHDSYVISYLSPLNSKTASSLDPVMLNNERSGKQDIPLQSGDYDFYYMNEWKSRNDNSRKELIPAAQYKTAETFYDEYVSGEYAGYFAPENIYVIGSDQTFSAGFETLARLVKCGAVFAGVSPAQSGNCFGMGIRPVSGLTNSKIKMQVSVRKVVEFPNDMKKGLLLSPDIPMDFLTFQRYGCDQNSPILMLLDRLQ